MKRLKRKFVSTLLIISLLLSVFGINASATVVEYNTVAHHHFENLEGHVPQNVNGSCSYVATSMLLSFYDSYWNDGIVAENYEGTRPSCAPTTDYPNGVARYKTENIEWRDYEEDGGSYSEFIYSSNSNGMLIDQYFHLYLLSLGIAQGFYEDGANSESFGITFEQQAANLDFYFDLRFGQNDYYLPYGETNEDIPFNIHVLYEFSPGSSRETVLQIIKEQVESGNPVLYRGSRLLTEEEETENINTSSLVNDGKIGHALLAYNVEDNGDVELHTGYTTDSYSKISTTEYDLRIGVLWIEINEEILPHSCSNNYYWYPTQSNICSCIAYKDLHPAHIHENSGEYVSIDANGHTYECIWGDTVEESHNHVSSSSISNSLHNSTCSCGYVFTEMHHFKQISPRYLSCIYCGYIRDEWGSGGNVIMGTEENEEKE